MPDRILVLGLAGACLAASAAGTSAPSPASVPGVPGLRGWPPLRDVDPECSGSFVCDGFKADEPDQLVNQNATEEGCIFGHVAEDHDCAVPCTGVSRKMCLCVSHETAQRKIKQRGAVTMVFGFCFAIVACCAGACLRHALGGAAEVTEPEGGSPPVAATELTRTQARRGRRVSLLTPEAEAATSRLITDRPNAARKRRALCQLFFSVFFLIWFFFAGFLFFFGLWLLVFQRDIYYDGCSS